MDPEKQPREPSLPEPETPSRGAWKLVAAAVALLLLYRYTTPTTISIVYAPEITVPGPSPSSGSCSGPHATDDKKEFDWYALTPSENITWTDCFDGQRCARLSLPLDYSAPTGPRTEIALRMIPARDAARRRGAILVNPGGPGGAGTDLIRRKGAQIAAVVGPQFDVLGFDPRGTGASTPSAQCFDSESQFNLWSLREPLIDIDDNTTVALRLSRATVEGERCRVAIGGRREEGAAAADWGIGRFMSTADVATDMLRITEKLGQDKLMYWGFSYGSILGQYFAAMYSDKVGRLVIDGVADGNDYRAGLWSTNLVDTDAVIASFFSFCHEAGPAKCPLYAPTILDIKERVRDIISSLDAAPVPVPFGASGPITISSRSMLEAFFEAAYAPLARYPGLASGLLAIETRNESALQSFAAELRDSVQCSCGPEMPPWRKQTEAWAAVACGDAPEFEYDPAEYEAIYRKLAADSALVAPLWAGMRLSCAKWPLRAKSRYTGPLAAENTSFPMLIAQPAFDTVCPLANAKLVQQRYKGAALLVQNSYGHCTLSAPSVCTAKAVRAYFADGELPAADTVCEVDELPFIGNVSAVQTMSAADTELLHALRELADEKFALGKPF